MKKIITIIAVIFTIVFTGCKDFLELEPEFKFRSEIGVGTLDAVSKTTTGMFDALQRGSLYGGGLIANSEFLADFIKTDNNSDFSLNQLRTRELNPFNDQARNLWTDAYYAINVANIVLDNLDQYESEDPELVA